MKRYTLLFYTQDGGAQYLDNYLALFWIVAIPVLIFIIKVFGNA